MLYDIKRNNFSNFAVFEENRLPARSYFIPFSSVTKAAKTPPQKRRQASDRVKVLSGQWDFKYYRHCMELPTTLDTDTLAFDTVPVPSCWTMQGYEPPYYTNVRYPYPVNPPEIPTKKAAGTYGDDINGETYQSGKKQFNSVGVYRRFCEVPNKDNHFILSFLGVSSCVEVYLNGEYIGYGEGSHNTSEFLLTGKIKKGKNELVCLVYKWCNGSYLEDQDFFRHNGIFRDVLLYVGKDTYVHNLSVTTAKAETGYDCFVSVDVRGLAGAKLKAGLYDKGKLLASKVVDAVQDARVEFGALDVEEWNAEIPRLYNLFLVLEYNGKVIECVKKDIGFKTVRIVPPGIFLVNGKRIVFKGVNHHDTSPTGGFVMSEAELERDIKLMKAFNMNMVRTSHYPPDPLFIELCDRYGLYVVDEADIETHGTRTNGQISHDLKWKHHFWDRVQRMYARDKNAASIVMWSLGNESGGYHCHDYCAERLRGVTSIPIHYEGTRWTTHGAFDVNSEMYTDVVALEKKLKKTYKTIGAHKVDMKEKPFFLCEYGHAMGVGPGALEDYWQLFQAHENAMGGCIWEFADHAIYHKDGKYAYTYGGDHGEYRHDGNFCMDGLFYPDRTPHTGAFAYKNVNRPLRAKVVGRHGLIEVTNYQDFRRSDYILIKGAIVQDGRVTGTFTTCLDIAPKGSARFNLILDDAENDTFLNLDYYDGEHHIASEQLVLSEELPTVRFAHQLSGRLSTFARDWGTGSVGNGIGFTQVGDMLHVSFGSGSIRFNRLLGTVTEYKVRGVNYFVPESTREKKGGYLYTNLYRAPLDNDRNIKRKWESAGYHNLKKVKVKVEAQQVDSSSVVVKMRYALAEPKRRKALFEVEDTFTIYKNGAVDVAMRLTPLAKGLPILPRVGKIVEVAAGFDKVIYYGRGPRECYPDFKEQSRIGVYQTTAQKMYEPYLMPQDNGNHTDGRYLVLRNYLGHGLMFLAKNKPFHFSVKRVSTKTLADAMHREDVVDERINYVSIDGFMGGVGSNSCGPMPTEEYLLKANKTYEMQFSILPFDTLKDSDIIYD